MDVSVETFNKIIGKQITTNFTQDLIKSNHSWIEPRIKLLHRKYGRGAVLIHFYTLNDYLSHNVETIDHVINPFHHDILWMAVQTDQLFLLNHQVMWLPIRWIDEYFKVPSNSCLRYYPLCTSYVTMFVTYKDKTQHHRYYNCVMSESFSIHPSDKFRQRLSQFASTIRCIKTSKLKYFKMLFPILSKQLSETNITKPYPLDLREYLRETVYFSLSDTKYKKYCATHPDNGKYPLHDSIHTKYKGAEISVVVMDSDHYVGHGYEFAHSMLWWLLQNKLLFGSKYEIEWILQEATKFHQYCNALYRVMIGLYGPRCSYCKRMGQKGWKHRFKMCAHCKDRYYCSRICQKRDWKYKHRRYCQLRKTFLHFPL
eukprot:770043_1